MIKVSCHKEGQIFFFVKAPFLYYKKVPETDIIKTF